ncbi:MAG: DUF4091 domain-containing protein [Ruminococcaceae bacterium]|nr:DUF4091 domain-containing protein [Oscillospiraceae bacterium]
MSIKAYIKSSMDIVFADSQIKEDSFSEIKALSNQPVSFQLAYVFENDDEHMIYKTRNLKVEIESEIKDYINLYYVNTVPATVIGGLTFDDWFVTTKPTLYPDPCERINDGKVAAVSFQWASIWVNINEDAEDIPSGEYEIRIKLSNLRDNEETKEFEKVIKIKIADAKLNEQKRYVTNWFHYDCISELSGTKPFSKEFYKFFKEYVSLAVKNGQNTILTPAFTPALDTEIGCERKTAQLVAIEKTGDKYTFDFSKLKEFTDFCQSIGMKYFEHTHFFTQWGAKAAPKIVVKENGKNKKLFGWHTDATGKEYHSFLKAYIKELKRFMKQNQLTDKFVFHVSDEPSIRNKDTYVSASKLIHNELKGFIICDALHDVRFYDEGIVSTPVPCTIKAYDFIGKAENMWMYYTGGETVEYLTNRGIGTPAERQRILGIQLYYYDIKGFLHWGYNAHHNVLCKKIINPYISPDMGKEFMSGTSYLVYPSSSGANPSVRLFNHRDAFLDLALLEKAETIIGRAAVIKIIDEIMPDFSLRYRVKKEQIELLTKKIIEVIEK